MKVNDSGFLVVGLDDAYSLDIDKFTVKELGELRLLSEKNRMIYNFLGAALYKKRKKRGDVRVGSRRLTRKDYGCEGIPELTRVPLVKNTLTAFLDKELSNQYLYNLLGFIEWMDFDYDGSIDFNNVDSMRECYIDYANYLFNKRSQSNVRKHKGYSKKSISFSIARSKQQSAILAMVYANPSLTKDIVKSWAIELKQAPSEKEFVFSLNVKEAIKTRDYHIYVFTSIYEHIFSSNQGPLKLEKNIKLGLKGSVVASHLVRDLFGTQTTSNIGIDKYKLVYGENGGILFKDIEEAYRKIHKKMGSSITYTLGYSALSLCSDFFEGRNITSYSKFGCYLFDIAIKSFCHIILLDTGCNCESLKYLPLVRARKLKKFGTKRMLSYKNKIGERVEISITSKLVRYWNMMIDLNHWKFGDIEGYMGVRNSKNSLMTAKIISRKSGWYDDIFPDNGLWVSGKEWRDYSTYLTLFATDDISFSAVRHNHTIPTGRKHYVKIDNAEALKSNHLFFKKMAEKVRLYKDQKIIRVQLLDGKKSYRGKTGRCTGSFPEPLDGLDTDAKIPECTKQIHCFFCKSYGLHANLDDVVMLLSIKKWLPIHGKYTSENADEYMVKYFPIIQRIDDIVSEFSSRNEKYKLIVEKAHEQIKMGNLNPYWQAKINAINTLEAIQ